jgi:glycosyltransferase involved in cell wall biosynthesis
MQKKDFKDLRIAIVHDYLNQYGGAERCLEVFHDLFPAAPIYTLVYRKDVLPQYKDWNLRPSFLQSFPGIDTHYKYYFPLFPLAVKTFDFSGFDLVVSISHAWVKGISKRKAIHICYCLTPVRYAWDLYDDYMKHEYIPIFFKALMPFLGWCLRSWDKYCAQRVDHCIAISQTVQKRVQKFYGRESEVIYPPANTQFYSIDPSVAREDFYLTVSRLKTYKRIDLIVEAFNQMKKKLVIIGNGSELGSLRKRAGETIQFETTLSDEQVRDYYRRARGFVFAGIEDFGLVNVEAQSCGLPVIAYGVAGAREVVLDGVSGILYQEQTVESLIKAVNRFETLSFDPYVVRECSLKFDTDEFKEKLLAFIEDKLSRV